MGVGGRDMGLVDDKKVEMGKRRSFFLVFVTGKKQEVRMP